MQSLVDTIALHDLAAVTGGQSLRTWRLWKEYKGEPRGARKKELFDDYINSMKPLIAQIFRL